MQPVLHEAQLSLQIILGIIFFLASAGKLIHPKAFVTAVAQYQIVPQGLVLLTSCIVISGEALIAVSHLTGYFLFTCIWLAIILIGSFAGAVLVNLARGRVVACYCFGHGNTVISKSTVMRLLLMAFGEGILAVIHQPVHPLQIGLVELLSGLFWSTVVAIISVWSFSIPDLVYLIRPIRTTLGVRNVK